MKGQPQLGKYVTIIILNWKRPDNIKKHILPKLVNCPLVGEIIISHGRTDTKFNCYSNHTNIIHKDDTKLNKKLGLSLRFYNAKYANYPIIVTIDDDIIVHEATLINMFNVFIKNAPCVVGRFGRVINSDLSYNHLDNNYNRTPIALTSLLMIPKKLCLNFLDNQLPILNYVKNNSKPFWNGEDIFISLLSIVYFKKLPYIVNSEKYFPVKLLRSQKDLEVAISQDFNHIKYRSHLLRLIIDVFKIPNEFLKPY